MELQNFDKMGISFPFQAKQKKLLLVLIGVVLITILVLYFGFRKEKIPSDSAPPAVDSQKKERSLEEIELDTSLFKNPQYQALKTDGAGPIEVGEAGRENPFAPY
ncbi:MAG: hypothetical protein A3I88_02765 [Candidatus Portnoybacteria bacterium RIFCSPLOWO2_12_FULL_39_9]|uniref:Uncharacterized protein n=1 Tax=Candidatus Portnoybacteria bacterium RIFCSPHIGHO2_12_FULL_38_9 TaxID=1801997 RepID=A0A1G2FE79_9BACT|nr:MAG: hypothetical protein A3H00_00880 [Candidatus Portnoybacteria bacterium RBG_13_40_8]OGZ36359.1 MAG: hypothetical protein A3J64_01800 [Candidatus Portnoybacteria bacterium RIFCSPHIGHO2_12_FULL_38_9]OGZ36831.1 MAG: hypothetical protein A2646_03790 [Candidatus Portnoybacteria bacterium RIFCSPHIGHO2_02_FULL_39_12]OGZ38358.1 MAG: hypothetical protein A3F21_00310 [Candidatus Portnoybacteria bacterium RIFCSPLOWO2_01_FULL_38_39]OGZ40159.1 MAG: hypothetical protein A3I88_02765 [Candidatus Portnoy